MARMDADGYFFIVGRKKRFLKIFGNRINLDEIEQMVLQETGLSCACGGVDDRLHFFITDDARREDVQQYISGKTSIHPSAVRIHAISEIPKNAAGKTLYTELEKYYD